NQPSLRMVGLDKFPEESRLAHPGLAHDPHDLTLASSGAIEGAAELLDLGGPANEAGQSSGRRHLQPRPRGFSSNQLVHLHWIRKTLDGYGAAFVCLDITLDELERSRGQENRSRLGELLHARRQVGGLADGSVVHVEVTADGPDDDLARIESD